MTLLQHTRPLSFQLCQKLSLENLIDHTSLFNENCLDIPCVDVSEYQAEFAYAKAVVSCKGLLKRTDVAALMLQLLQSLLQRAARLRSQATDEIVDRLLYIDLRH